MIRIENFKIEADRYGFILQEIKTQDDKESKNFGKEYVYSTTYHGNTKQVVNKLLEAGLKNYIDTSDFGAVLAYMSNVKTSVKQLIELKRK